MGTNGHSWALEAVDVSKSVQPRYGLFKSDPSERREVLENVSLSAAVGEIVCVAGSQGSGKSILLRLLAGQSIPSGGSVQIRGEDTGRKRDIARRAVRMISPRGLEKAPGRTGQSVLGAAGQTSAQKAHMQSVRHMLDIESLLGRSPATYSGGERWCFEIARALLSKTIVIADDLFQPVVEPMASKVRATLKEYAHEWGGTVVYSSTSLADAQGFADRAYILRDGHCDRLALAPDVLGRPSAASFRVKFIGKSAVSISPSVSEKSNPSERVLADVSVLGESDFLTFFREVLR